MSAQPDPADVEIIGAKLAVHPVLALLAIQEDGAPEALAQIRDCATKIAGALIVAGRLLPPTTDRPTAPDLAALRQAVQTRARVVADIVRRAHAIGLPMTTQQARLAYDVTREEAR